MKHAQRFAIIYIALQFITLQPALPLTLNGKPASKITMALTVDDLPTHGPVAPGYSRSKIVQDLLEVFEVNRIPNVYGFVNGGRLSNDISSEGALKLWLEKKHPLGNHTYLHPSLSKISADDFIEEIRLNDVELAKWQGPTIPKYFRYPFLHEGNTVEKRQKVRNYLKQNNYIYAPVTLDYKDYLFNDPVARCIVKEDTIALDELRKLHADYAVQILQHTLRESPNIFSKPIAHVLLIHVGLSQALWFKDIVKAYQEAGVIWKPLEEVLRDPVYRVDPGLPFESGGLFTSQNARSKGIQFTAYPNLSELEKKLKSFCN